VPKLAEGFLKKLKPLPPRQKHFKVPKLKEPTEENTQLQSKLNQWRCEKAIEADEDHGPTMYLADNILEQIIDVSRHPKGPPRDLQEFTKRISWSSTQIYAAELLPLIHSIYPPRSIAKLEELEIPLTANLAEPMQSELSQPIAPKVVEKSRALPTCGRCGEVGHKLTSVIKCLQHPKRLGLIKEEPKEIATLPLLHDSPLHDETTLTLAKHPLLHTTYPLTYSSQEPLVPRTPLASRTNQHLNTPPPTGGHFVNHLYRHHQHPTQISSNFLFNGQTTPSHVPISQNIAPSLYQPYLPLGTPVQPVYPYQYPTPISPFASRPPFLQPPSPLAYRTNELHASQPLTTLRQPSSQQNDQKTEKNVLIVMYFTSW
jgi:hypothetical protein